MSVDNDMHVLIKFCHYARANLEIMKNEGPFNTLIEILFFFTHRTKYSFTEILLRPLHKNNTFLVLLLFNDHSFKLIIIVKTLQRFFSEYN